MSNHILRKLNCYNQQKEAKSRLKVLFQENGVGLWAYTYQPSYFILNNPLRAIKWNMTSQRYLEIVQTLVEGCIYATFLTLGLGGCSNGNCKIFPI